MIKKNGRKAALHNLGCKVNAYETEAMEQQLIRAGYEIVPFEPGADVYVINTCSVTNVADRKSRQMLHKARKMNPDSVVVAAGCYVQTAREKTGLAVDADIILGNNAKTTLVKALDDYFAGEQHAACENVPDLSHIHTYENMRLDRTREHTRAFIKVQDGCNQFCSYCIIPYARGHVRSRSAEDVVREVKALSQRGITEIVLTGIHLSSWGTDLGGLHLMDLIESVSAAEGISRIRLGSLEPGIVTEEFARRLGKVPQICPHFHLSLQSGSDSVLSRMHRRYNTDSYLEKCRILRETFDRPALTTDVIVGFPQESEEEFQETVDFLKKVSFYETHIFKYSRREGTAAARMDGQISEQVKEERSRILISLGARNKEAFIQSRQGTRCDVLWEEEHMIDGKPFMTGYTREYIRCAVPVENEQEARKLAGSVSTGILGGKLGIDYSEFLY